LVVVRELNQVGVAGWLVEDSREKVLFFNSVHICVFSHEVV